MKSAEYQFAHSTTSTPNSPLKQLRTLWSAHITTAPALREQSYALGWARAQLSGALCDTSRNQGLFEDQFPTVGDPDKPRLAIYHHGMLPGFTSAVYLFPETQTAIVLLSNSVAINDGPDWIAHMMIQTIFNDSKRLDYISGAHQTVGKALAIQDAIAAELEEETDASKPPKQPNVYTGTYLNRLETFAINIVEENGELVLNFQGFLHENYALRHLRGDEFSWYIDFDEQVSRGRGIAAYKDYWKIKFETTNGSDKAQKLFWVIEKDLADGAEFKRRNQAINHDEI